MGRLRLGVVAVLLLCAPGCRRASDSVVTLATEQGGTVHLALDETYIYWAGEGGVARVPKKGGSPMGLTPPMSPGIVDLALDAQTVFYADGAGTIASVPSAGGTPKILAVDPDGPVAIAVDNTDVFWVARGAAANDGAWPTTWPNGSVKSVPKAGGQVRLLARGQSGVQDIAVDSSSTYWTTCSRTADDILQIAKSGGLPTVIATRQQCPRELVLDGRELFWTRRMGRGVARLSHDKATASTLTTDVGNAWGLAVDAEAIYTSDIDRNDSHFEALLSIPRNGGPRHVLATGANYRALDIVFDSSAIYWASFDHETSLAYIRRLKK